MDWSNRHWRKSSSASSNFRSGEEPAMTCPKCGFEQDGGTDCLRCGIIMARYKPPPASPPQPTPTVDSLSPQPSSGGFCQEFIREFFRALRWVLPVVAVVVLLAILRQAPPPQIKT